MPFTPPTLDRQGPMKWDQFPVLEHPGVALTVDGYTLAMKLSANAGLTSGALPTGSAIEMQDGTYATQYSLPKPKQPFCMAPCNYTFGFKVTHQADMIRVRRAGRRPAVLLFLGLHHEDEWLIPNADAGQTTWRTSRRIGWNGTTRTHATHPPYAEIDGVEQVIVTTGTPTAGQVKIPTSQTADQYYDTVTTPVLTAGELLTVRYWPELIAKIEVQDSFQTFNSWQLDVSVQELLMGEY